MSRSQVPARRRRAYHNLWDCRVLLVKMARHWNLSRVDLGIMVHKIQDSYLLDVHLNLGNSGCPVSPPDSRAVIGVGDAYKWDDVMVEGLPALSQNQPTTKILAGLSKPMLDWA